MINVVLNKEIVNLEEALYAIYYLTKSIDTEIRYSTKASDQGVNIFYGFEEQTNPGIYIPVFSGNEYKAAFSPYGDTKFMHSESEAETAYKAENDIISFGFDIVYSSFYLLSCKEEYENSIRDDKERFLAAFSSRADYIEIPFIQVHRQILLSAIKLLDGEINEKESQFEIFLTHDVDSINSRDKYVLLHNGKDILTNRNKPLLKRVKTFISEIIKNRHLQILSYCEIEDRYKARSEFYFIEGVRHRLGKRYDLSSISHVIKDITGRGWKCGIHTNYFSYIDTDRISEEKSNIERVTKVPVVSCRNHYLRFKVPESYECLSSAGIRCDSTIGFSDRNGLRAGTVEGFIPFNISSNKLIELYEVPLLVMDGIVMENAGSIEEKWEHVHRLLKMALKYKGSASVLWHQRMMCYEDYKEIYIRILEFVVQNNGKFVTSDDYVKRLESEKSEINSIFEGFNK